jgi:phosphoglycolate phosphatase-like HAD superfamily hydrolase
MLGALIWDVDGTIAETERDGHRVAFNQALKEFGLPWRWDVQTYDRLLRVPGGLERLLHDMAARDEAPVSQPERERLARPFIGARASCTRASSRPERSLRGPACSA